MAEDQPIDHWPVVVTRSVKIATTAEFPAAGNVFEHGGFDEQGRVIVGAELPANADGSVSVEAGTYLIRLAWPA